ncbi:hypothetical protein A8325_004308, partial [Escherichia coli]|nr:hypothetical protein [Escherichia coli]
MKKQIFINNKPPVVPYSGTYAKIFKYIEIPLPFFYFIYTSGEPFHISVQNTVIYVSKYNGIFINKLVPF